MVVKTENYNNLREHDILDNPDLYQSDRTQISAYMSKSSESEVEAAIIEIYRDIHRNETDWYNAFDSICVFDNQFKYPLSLDILGVTYNAEKIREIYKQTGTLQLHPLPMVKKNNKNNQPYQLPDKLIIGCGHKPLCNGGGYYHHEWGMSPDETLHEKIEYQNVHTHDGWLTINNDIRFKSDLITMFGNSELHMLPDHHFSVIALEVVDVDQHTFSTLQIERLLKPGGEIRRMQEGILEEKLNSKFEDVTFSFRKSLKNLFTFSCCHGTIQQESHAS